MLGEVETPNCRSTAARWGHEPPEADEPDEPDKPDAADEPVAAETATRPAGRSQGTVRTLFG